ncbi:phospholipase D family protein [Jannaschia pohangensis]|uniref:Phospholipase D n=1 Tax=Jannaschia pohangensis TaxID=390807 RepID=A0A1I3IJZ3_9RHOB|nr:phospholipase D-like domain-containing protein [Jannaschia pohangensis]SFI48093.1 phospholipase D1/2 [Jannaschia pohangensis]
MEDQRESGAEVLLTASEAFPAFERLFLNAKSRISLGFRIFDPATSLHSPEGRAIGTDWFDLLAHTLARGVKIRLIISDFDAIVRPDYHQRALRCLRMAIAAAEVSGRPDLLDAQVALHPARVGWIPSLALWPKARGYLLQTVTRLNAMAPAARARALAEMPGVRPYLDITPDGVSLRSWKMPRLTPVTHHQKLAVADGTHLYIGGLDLNERRFDTLQHSQPAAQTWHDAQVLVESPVAKEAETHLDSFLKAVEGKSTPPPLPHLLRTLSRKRGFDALYLSPRVTLTELARDHREAIAAARQLIYLETQFLRDSQLTRQLVKAAHRNPDLGLIVILPAAPDDVAFDKNKGRDARYGEYLQAKCVKKLQQAFGQRVFLGAPAQRRSAPPDGRATTYGAPLIYLHAKVSIIDPGQSNGRAIVSSANLNGRSMQWDTEAGISLDDPADVTHLRDRCFAHWLGGEVAPEFTDPATVLGAWRERAKSNARRAPEDRDGYLLPYSSGPARRFGRNLPGIPEEIV